VSRSGQPTSEPLRIGTWNVHRWTGTDGWRDPLRIVAAIRAMRIDLIALQEVDPPCERAGGIAGWLEERTGCTAIVGPTLTDPRGDYGNVLLSRLPVLAVRRHDLSVAPSAAHEPRGAVDVDIAWGGRSLRVMATHLGLRKRERDLQWSRLRGILEQSRCAVDVLLGDLNEWRPLWPRLGGLRRDYHWAPSRRTFPATCPVLSLDRALLARRWRVVSVRAVRDGGVSEASDHLPLRLTLRSGEQRETSR
jgi:endonuclease/exonuclease/phosphatase family metal-dependent hydrolase